MSSPWYKDGLRFHCTGCGKCCTGAPGYVWVSTEERQAIANFLNLSLAEFEKRYTRLVGGKVSLLENRKNYDCVFLKDKRCTIYEVRPTQCKTFPWWKSNLASKQSWEETASYCEGVEHPESSLISLDHILSELEKDS